MLTCWHSTRSDTVVRRRRDDESWAEALVVSRNWLESPPDRGLNFLFTCHGVNKKPVLFFKKRSIVSQLAVTFVEATLLDFCNLPGGRRKGPSQSEFVFFGLNYAPNLVKCLQGHSRTVYWSRVEGRVRSLRLHE